MAETDLSRHHMNSRKSNQALEGKIRGVKNLFMIMKIGLTNYNFKIGLASQKKKKKPLASWLVLIMSGISLSEQFTSFMPGLDS